MRLLRRSWFEHVAGGIHDDNRCRSSFVGVVGDCEDRFPAGPTSLADAAMLVLACFQLRRKRVLRRFARDTGSMVRSFLVKGRAHAARSC
jgi:hypothetical protein